MTVKPLWPFTLQVITQKLEQRQNWITQCKYKIIGDVFSILVKSCGKHSKQLLESFWCFWCNNLCCCWNIKLIQLHLQWFDFKPSSESHQENVYVNHFRFWKVPWLLIVNCPSKVGFEVFLSHCATLVMSNTLENFQEL